MAALATTHSLSDYPRLSISRYRDRLRRDMQAFIEGQLLSSLPELELQVAQLFFVCITERLGEAGHVPFKQKMIHRHHGTISVANAVRALDYQAICESAELFKELCDCAVVRVPDIAPRLNIQNHPWIVSSKGSAQHSAVPLLSQVIYRCDMLSKFQSFGEALAAHKMAKKKQK